GVNLEPMDESAEYEGIVTSVSEGRIASNDNLVKANVFGFDFICLTGNPSTGVSNKEIVNATKRASELFNGVVISGKMHSAGVSERVIDLPTIEAFAKAGADVILV